VSIDDGGLVVKPDAGAPQLAEEAKSAETRKRTENGDRVQNGGAEETEEGVSNRQEQQPPRARRFHGSVTLNPVGLGRDASDMANEIIQHLMKQPGAKVEITLKYRLRFQTARPTTWCAPSARTAEPSSSRPSTSRNRELAQRRVQRSLVPLAVTTALRWPAYFRRLLFGTHRSEGRLPQQSLFVFFGFVTGGTSPSNPILHHPNVKPEIAAYSHSLQLPSLNQPIHGAWMNM
jgi:hypothetical protein